MAYLQLSQVLWSFVNPHAPKSNPNGPRGDNDHPVALFSQLDRRVNDESQDGEQRLVSFFIDDGACPCTSFTVSQFLILRSSCTNPT